MSPVQKPMKHRVSSKAQKRCAEFVEACTDFVISEIGLTLSPLYSYINALNYMNERWIKGGRETLPTFVGTGRNIPNLGVFKKLAFY